MFSERTLYEVPDRVDVRFSSEDRKTDRAPQAHRRSIKLSDHHQEPQRAVRSLGPDQEGVLLR